MGMTIEEALEYLTDFSIYSPYQEAIDKVSAYIEQMQANYENRLKADMAAMLEDFDLQIDEFDSGCGWDGYIKKIDVHEIIQQKINALKGETDDKRKTI